MSILTSTLDPNSESFSSNRRAMEDAIAQMRAVQQKVIDKSFEAKPKFAKRGKIVPHERIQLLLDAGSPFVELLGLIGYQMFDDKDGSDAGGGVISGIGFVGGVRCLISASNSAIKGGTMSPMGVQKTIRLQEIALENKLPVITLTESGGANLNYAAEVQRRVKSPRAKIWAAQKCTRKLRALLNIWLKTTKTASVWRVMWCRCSTGVSKPSIRPSTMQSRVIPSTMYWA